MKRTYFSPPFVVEISKQTHLRILNFLKRVCPMPQTDEFVYSRLAIVRKKASNKEATYHLIAGEMELAEKLVEKKNKSNEPRPTRADSAPE